MVSKTILAFLATTTVLAACPITTQAAEPDALFSDDAILEVTMSAPFEQIMSERPEEDYVAGKFEFKSDDGASHELDIGIRTRGEFRRRKDICRFAPLRINFKKSQLDATIFDKQDKLKLVTHCQNGSDRYEQSVISEYLAYRILNIMTDVSFRVRLLHVNYVYTDSDNDSVETYAVMIEHKNRLAKRIELPEKETPKILVGDMQAEYANVTSVYQFLIGNSDFSPVSNSPGASCCHNHVLFGLEEPPYWSIPFDFDQSGIVNAPHAVTNPRFNLRSVQQRIYRGRCLNGSVLPDTLDKYRAKRPDIEGLVSNQPGLTKSRRKIILNYIESFYKTINSPKRVDSQLVKACI